MGPCQPTAELLPNKEFPSNKFGRKFHPSWYLRKLGDGSVANRIWLSYSISNDKIYCLDCLLFARKGVVQQAPKAAWTSVGFNTWSTGHFSIISHESSSVHVHSSLQRKIRQSSLKILPALHTLHREEVIMNREIVKELIDITLYLGRHSLAFRGHRESNSQRIQGNFKDLCLLLSKYSPPMASYITQLSNMGKRPKQSFISWRKQNMLIDSLSNYISLQISNSVREAKFFCISIDTSFDISHKEQVSFVIRYIDEKESQVNFKVHERLIALKESPKTTAFDLCELFKNVCVENNLDWKTWLVGQSYDGAANMSGQYNGLQTLIQSENPRATFVWCWSHRLNLVVTDAVSIDINSMDLFGNLEKLYDFISSSKKRAAIFVEKQNELYPKKQVRRVKKVGTTRWMSHKYAVDTVLDTLNALHETLNVIQLSEGPSDRRAGSEASGLFAYFTSNRFIYSAFIFKKILEIIEPLSNFLQSPDFDLLAALSMITEKLSHLQNLRREDVFNSLISKSHEYTAKNCNIEFVPLQEKRIKKRKRMPGEGVDDSPISNALQKLKVETFYGAFYCIIIQIKKRFMGDNNNCKGQTIGLLKDFSLLSKKRLDETRLDSSTVPLDSFSSFSQIYGYFIDEIMLRSEYIQFAESLPHFLKNIALPTFLHASESDSENSNISSEEEERYVHGSTQNESMNHASLGNIFK